MSSAVAPYAEPSVGSEPTDLVLVAAVRRGDDRAFERLFARYQRRIAAYVYGMVGDHGRAEDITQEIFISALRRMRSTERPIAFRPWIYEIAKNACIDQFRRARRAEEVSFEAAEALRAANDGRFAQRDLSPDAAVDQKQALEDLCGAFGGLSDTHHQILVLREFDGLSYREIGEKLGMSRQSVESTLFRARRRLSQEYDELSSGERCGRVQSLIAAAAEGAISARDTRRMSRHVSDCRLCRRQALLAGVDPAVLTRRPSRRDTVAGKVAALFPFPFLLRRRPVAEGDAMAVAHPGSGHGQTLLTHWSTMAPTVSEPVVAGWSKAAATAATVVLAGVGATVPSDSGRQAARDSAREAAPLTRAAPGWLVSSVSPKPLRAGKPVPTVMPWQDTRPFLGAQQQPVAAPVTVKEAQPVTAPVPGFPGLVAPGMPLLPGDPVSPLFAPAATEPGPGLEPGAAQTPPGAPPATGGGELPSLPPALPIGPAAVTPDLTPMDSPPAAGGGATKPKAREPKGADPLAPVGPSVLPPLAVPPAEEPPPVVGTVEVPPVEVPPVDLPPVEVPVIDQAPARNIDEPAAPSPPVAEEPASEPGTGVAGPIPGFVIGLEEPAREPAAEPAPEPAVEPKPAVEQAPEAGAEPASGPGPGDDTAAADAPTADGAGQ